MIQINHLKKNEQIQFVKLFLENNANSIQLGFLKFEDKGYWINMNLFSQNFDINKKNLNRLLKTFLDKKNPPISKSQKKKIFSNFKKDDLKKWRYRSLVIIFEPNEIWDNFNENIEQNLLL